MHFPFHALKIDYANQFHRPASLGVTEEDLKNIPEITEHSSYVSFNDKTRNSLPLSANSDVCQIELAMASPDANDEHNTLPKAQTKKQKNEARQSCVKDQYRPGEITLSRSIGIFTRLPPFPAILTRNAAADRFRKRMDRRSVVATNAPIVDSVDSAASQLLENGLHSRQKALKVLSRNNPVIKGLKPVSKTKTPDLSPQPRGLLRKYTRVRPDSCRAAILENTKANANAKIQSPIQQHQQQRRKSYHKTTSKNNSPIGAPGIVSTDPVHSLIMKDMKNQVSKQNLADSEVSRGSESPLDKNAADGNSTSASASTGTVQTNTTATTTSHNNHADSDTYKKPEQTLKIAGESNLSSTNNEYIYARDTLRNFNGKSINPFPTPNANAVIKISNKMTDFKKSISNNTNDKILEFGNDQRKPSDNKTLPLTNDQRLENNANVEVPVTVEALFDMQSILSATKIHSPTKNSEYHIPWPTELEYCNDPLSKHAHGSISLSSFELLLHQYFPPSSDE